MYNYNPGIRDQQAIWDIIQQSVSPTRRSSIGEAAARIQRDVGQQEAQIFQTPQQAPGMPGQGLYNTESAQSVYSKSLPYTPPPTQEQRQQDFDFQQNLANPFNKTAALLRQQELADFANQANMNFQNPQDMSDYFSQGMGAERKIAPDYRAPITPPTPQQPGFAKGQTPYALPKILPSGVWGQESPDEQKARLLPLKQDPAWVSRVEGAEAGKALQAQQAQQAAAAQETNLANIKQQTEKYKADKLLEGESAKAIATSLYNNGRLNAQQFTLSMKMWDIYTKGATDTNEFYDKKIAEIQAKIDPTDPGSAKAAATSIRSLEAGRAKSQKEWDAYKAKIPAVEIGGTSMLPTAPGETPAPEVAPTGGQPQLTYEQVLANIKKNVPPEDREMAKKIAAEDYGKKTKAPSKSPAVKPSGEPVAPTKSKPKVIPSRPKPTPGIAKNKYMNEGKGAKQTAKEIVNEFPNATSAELSNVVGRDLGWDSNIGKEIISEIRTLLKRKGITVGKGSDFTPTFVPPKAY